MKTYSTITLIFLFSVVLTGCHDDDCSWYSSHVTGTCPAVNTAGGSGGSGGGSTAGQSGGSGGGSNAGQSGGSGGGSTAGQSGGSGGGSNAGSSGGSGGSNLQLNSGDSAESSSTCTSYCNSNDPECYDISKCEDSKYDR